MQVERRWWLKKDPTFYLLDIAILLAIFRQINNDDQWLGAPYSNFIEDNGPLVGAAPTVHYPHQFDGPLYSSKMLSIDLDRITSDYETVMADALRRIPGTVRSQLRGADITALMLRIPRTNVTAHSESSANSFNRNLTEHAQNWMNAWNSTRLDVFNDTMSNAHEHIEDLLSNNSQITEQYNNSDDVRWQRYLAQHNQTEKHCDQNDTSSNCTDVGILEDLESLEKVNNDESRLRTTSVRSVESGIEIESELSTPNSQNHTYHAFNTLLSPIASEESQSTEDTCQKHSSNSNHSNRQNAIWSEVEDMDLMQMMYEQDCDIGFDWHHLTNEPVKQIKDVDDVNLEKNNNSADLDNFIIDGETGEQIPVKRKQTPQVTITPPAQQMTQFVSNTTTTNNSGLNIDDYLDLFNESVNEMQAPPGENNKLTQEEKKVIVNNLTSLMNQSNSNNTDMQPNEDLWEQIADLSELTGINLQGQQNVQQLSPLQHNVINTNVSLTSPSIPQPTIIQHRMLEEPTTNTFNQSFNQCTDNQSAFSNPISYGSPTYNNPLQMSPNYLPSPVSSNDGVPMDGVSFSPMSSNSDLREPNMLLDQLNNFQFNMDTRGSSPHDTTTPITSSQSEPGQLFFEQNLTQDLSNTISDLVPINAIDPFPNNVSGPYLNPSTTSFHPPPLGSLSLSVVNFSKESEPLGGSTVDHSAISDYCESDSGISLDHSPGGFGFKSRALSEDKTFNSRDSGIKSELGYSNHNQTFSLSELKAIEHNHTYNGTAGKPKIPKKKNDKSLLSLGRESRDERKARELNIPFTLDEIIMSPVEDYNEMISRTPLTPPQQALVKDIRRRGKNKVDVGSKTLCDTLTILFCFIILSLFYSTYANYSIYKLCGPL
ncbi:unnamed protein product [Clavelina lepadiformis]|uniref:Uncharacterized protein n=1 Tax=Clavelina lepadiformis TaxID=159417 RepID=A0ABP0EVB2_CLALP